MLDELTVKAIGHKESMLKNNDRIKPIFSGNSNEEASGRLVLPRRLDDGKAAGHEHGERSLKTLDLERTHLLIHSSESDDGKKQQLNKDE